MVNLVDMGYRTKAQRIAEFRLLCKNAGVTTYQRKILEKTLVSVCDELQDCAKVRGALVMKGVQISQIDRHAIWGRKEKQVQPKKKRASFGSTIPPEIRKEMRG